MLRQRYGKQSISKQEGWGPAAVRSPVRLLNQVIQKNEECHSGWEQWSTCPVRCPGSSHSRCCSGTAQACLQPSSLPLAQHPPSHQGCEQGHPCPIFSVTAYGSAAHRRI